MLFPWLDAGVQKDVGIEAAARAIDYLHHTKGLRQVEVPSVAAVAAVAAVAVVAVAEVAVI